MAGQRPLEPYVEVRVLPGQHSARIDDITPRSANWPRDCTPCTRDARVDGASRDPDERGHGHSRVEHATRHRMKIERSSRFPIVLPIVIVSAAVAAAALYLYGEGRSNGATLDAGSRANPQDEPTGGSSHFGAIGDGTAAEVSSKRVRPNGRDVQKQARTAPSREAKRSSVVMVRVTERGRKYHRDECPSVHGAGRLIPIDEARDRYSPCKTCQPPG